MSMIDRQRRTAVTLLESMGSFDGVDGQRRPAGLPLDGVTAEALAARHARRRGEAKAPASLPRRLRLPLQPAQDSTCSPTKRPAMGKSSLSYRGGTQIRVSISYSAQMLAQITEKPRASLLSTTGTIAAFRCAPEDGDVLADKFGQLHRDFNAASLNELERGEAMVKIGGNDVRRVKGAVPGSGFGLAEIVRKQTRRHYARPRAEVDRWVQKTFASAPASLDEVHMIVGARPRKRRALKKPPKRPDRMGS